VDVEQQRLRIKDCYSIARTFGSGGFAVVRHGVHSASRKDVCVKVVNKEKAGKTYRSHIVEAGMYEALLGISRECPHHNVVRYWDFFESANRFYVVMENLKGCELSVALTERGAKWSERNCAGVMRDLLSALQYLHEVAGIYHRDVKLENLRFRGRSSGPMAGRKVDGGLVLLDFGLSRFIGQDWDGRFGGTELYTAPEVSGQNSENGGFSPAVDLWSAGVILHVLLTGSFPFEREDVQAKRAAECSRAAVESFEQRMALEGRRVPSQLLRGLLQADPARRLTASQALKDDWLELAPDLPAAASYEQAVMKSGELSRQHKVSHDANSVGSTSTPMSKVAPTNFTPASTPATSPDHKGTAGAAQVSYV
jgi:serine/threonine protein kinase